MLPYSWPPRSVGPMRMRLTAVGKIFKPALRRHEIRDALALALSEAGVMVHWIRVVEDRARGACVEVALPSPAQEARAREVLGRCGSSAASKIPR